MSNGLVQILDGNTFVVSDSNGDIEASLTDPTGLFSFDTRFLSKWVLTIDGQRLNALSVDDLQYFETLLPGAGIGNRVRRRQAIRHPAARRRERLPRGADHPQPRGQAGRARRPHRGRLGRSSRSRTRSRRRKYSARVDRGRLLLGYERETFKRETAISRRPRPARQARSHFRSADSAARPEWSTDLDIVTAEGAGGCRSGRSTRAERNGRGRAWS